MNKFTEPEILEKIKEWYEIVSEIPNSDVCDVPDMANDVAYEMQRAIYDMED